MNVKNTFNRILKSYTDAKTFCGLYPTSHNRNADFEILLKSFWKHKQKNPELNLSFTKLVNHYVASWEKHPLGNSRFDWTKQGTNLNNYYAPDYKNVKSKSRSVFTPTHPLEKSSFEEFKFYNSIVDKTITVCLPYNMCKICKKFSSKKTK